MDRKAKKVDENPKMCKTELKTKVTDRIREKENCKVTSAFISSVVDEVFDVMMEELIKGRGVSISKFGTFSLFTTKRFLARHPQDRTEFYYRQPQTRISFKMSKIFKSNLNDKE